MALWSRWMGRNICRLSRRHIKTDITTHTRTLLAVTVVKSPRVLWFIAWGCCKTA